MFDPSRDTNAGLVALNKRMLEREERKRYRGYLLRNTGYKNMQVYSMQRHMMNQHKWQAFVKMIHEADYWKSKKLAAT